MKIFRRLRAMRAAKNIAPAPREWPVYAPETKQVFDSLTLRIINRYGLADSSTPETPETPNAVPALQHASQSRLDATALARLIARHPASAQRARFKHAAPAERSW